MAARQRSGSGGAAKQVPCRWQPIGQTHRGQRRLGRAPGSGRREVEADRQEGQLITGIGVGVGEGTQTTMCTQTNTHTHTQTHTNKHTNTHTHTQAMNF